MGMLVDGRWTTENAGVVDPKGNFVRRDGQFRNWITADGSSPFSAEAGRYHLYVSAACPWAHRTLILRGLKKLDDIVSLSIVDPLMTDDGWHFSDGDGCVPDTVNGCDLLRDVYLKADPAVTTRVTVPVLWDKQQQTIVSNESSEIMRMFGAAFDAIGAAPHDYYPEGLQADIDRGCVSKVVEIGFGASPSGLSFAAVRLRGQGFRRRLADRGFPIHRLCASGFGRKRGAPRGASALFRDTAARSVF